jgi:hypothetical protein
MNKIILIILISLASGLARAEDDFAWRLAYLEEGRQLEENSLEVNRAKNALKIAMTVCNERTKEQLGDQAWYVTQVLRKENIYARPVDILEGLKAILDGVDVKQDCGKVMASYAAGRIGSGQSHSEAVAGMRVIMNMTGTITYGK